MGHKLLIFLFLFMTVPISVSFVGAAPFDTMFLFPEVEECDLCEVVTQKDQEGNVYMLYGSDYRGYEDSRLIKMNRKGDVVWTFRFSDNQQLFAVKPAITNDGTVYVSYIDPSSTDPNSGGLAAISDSGELKWRFSANVASTPTIDQDHTVYFGTGNYTMKVGPYIKSSVFAINPNGTLKWEYEVDGDGLFHKIFVGDYVYVSSGNTLYAFTLSGDVVWQLSDQDEEAWNQPFSSVIDEDGDYLYFYEKYNGVGHEAELIAVDKEGQVQSRVLLKGDFLSLEKTIFKVDNYHLSQLNRDGIEVWSQELREEQGMVKVKAQGDYVIAIQSIVGETPSSYVTIYNKEGTIVQTFEMSLLLENSLVMNSETIYFSTNNGKIILAEQAVEEEPFKVWSKPKTVVKNHDWTVEFNIELEEELVTSQNIYILDLQHNPIETTLSLDGNKVIVHAPEEGYKQESGYTLYVTNKLAKEAISQIFHIE